MRLWPAIDIPAVTGGDDPDVESDLILAAVDEFGPTATEQRGNTFRVFFPTTAARAAAQAALATNHYSAAAVDVDDEDWARRSQEGLGPVTVGRITVYPTPIVPNRDAPNPQSQVPNPISMAILPSMGFGTGHHATTRLCLAALQELEVTGRIVLDVGTGSGVLAIAASMLGAAQALGIDNDPDAVQAATDNVPLNPGARVSFRVADLSTATLPPADIVTANLTSALLQRSAGVLAALVKPGGILIVSGFLEDEHWEVGKAFPAFRATWQHQEQGWVALAMKKP